MNLNWSETELLSEDTDLNYYQLWSDKGGAWTYVGEEIGDLYDAELIAVEDKNSPYYGYPILDDGSWRASSEIPK
jgi:hypothetical protein